MHRLVVTAVVAIAVIVGPVAAGPAQANDDPSSEITFYDAHGDVSRGHDIQRVFVDNDNRHVRIKLWHRDLRPTRQYSFRLYLNTELASQTPEVKAYGAFPNADYAACSTSTWSTSAVDGCDPEDAATQCRLDFIVHWQHDTTVFDFTRTQQCLAGASAVGVNISIKEYHPTSTRWDYARERRAWYPPVPRDT
jgi:hypothetical protein